MVEGGVIASDHLLDTAHRTRHMGKNVEWSQNNLPGAPAIPSAELAAHFNGPPDDDHPNNRHPNNGRPNASQAGDSNCVTLQTRLATA
jgi:hypothetical protein